MRTRSNNSEYAIQVASLISEVQSDIQSGTRYIEFRFTCKKASGSNKVAFYFHGGRMIFHEGKFFASFRPLPWIKGKDGEPKLNPDGSIQTGSVWAKVVSKPAVELSPENLMFLEAIKLNPDLLTFAPIEVQNAYSTELHYQDFDLKTWIESFSEGMSNVKFTFNVPSQFKSSMEILKNQIDSEDSYYSLVMRISLDEPIYGLSELQQEYESEEYYKSFPIKPTYVGFIQELTRQDAPRSSFINPQVVNAAADAALKSAAVKSEEYLNLNYLKQQAALMKEQLTQIGTGKKAHLQTLTDLNDAAKARNKEEFEAASQLLLAIANRGENSHLSIEKATAYIETAKTLFINDAVEATINQLFD